MPVAIAAVPAAIEAASLALDDRNSAWAFEETTGLFRASDALAGPLPYLCLNEWPGPQCERRMP